MSYTCAQCQANVPDDLVIAGSDIWLNVPIHLHDFGPAHHQLEVHPVYAGSRSDYSTYADPMAASTGIAALAPMADPAGTVIWADVSHYQVPASGAYPRSFLSYKVSQSTTSVDANAAPNGHFGDANSGPGKAMVGHQGYLVWYPGAESQQASLFAAHVIEGPYFCWMLDVESWSGSITGNHSAALTQLAEAMADLFGANHGEVYGNQGDLDSIYPNRPSWLKVHKARYSNTPPAAPYSTWQYSNGDAGNPVPSGWPRSSAPFGACDHNAYQGSLASFQSAYGLTPAATPTEDDEMSFRIMQNPRGTDVWAIGNLWQKYLSLGTLPVWQSMADNLSGSTVEKPDATHWDQIQTRILLTFGATGGPANATAAFAALVSSAISDEMTALAVDIGAVPGAVSTSVAAAIPSASVIATATAQAIEGELPTADAIATAVVAKLPPAPTGAAPTAAENAEATVDLLAQRTAPPA